VLIDNVNVVKFITLERPDIRFAIILDIASSAPIFATSVGGA
jgi:hypothetical protein